MVVFVVLFVVEYVDIFVYDDYGFYVVEFFYFFVVWIVREDFGGDEQIVVILWFCVGYLLSVVNIQVVEIFQSGREMVDEGFFIKCCILDQVLLVLIISLNFEVVVLLVKLRMICLFLLWVVLVISFFQ